MLAAEFHLLSRRFSYVSQEWAGIAPASAQSQTWADVCPSICTQSQALICIGTGVCFRQPVLTVSYVTGIYSIRFTLGLCIIHMFICAYVYNCLYTCVYVHSYINCYIHVCMCIHISTVYIHLYVCIYINCLYSHVCVHAYINCLYTHVYCAYMPTVWEFIVHCDHTHPCTPLSSSQMHPHLPPAPWLHVSWCPHHLPSVLATDSWTWAIRWCVDILPEATHLKKNDSPPEAINCP